MSFKNFFLNESSDKTIIKLTDASKAQELEQYLSTSSIQFSKTADDVFEIMSPKSVVAKLPFDAEFLDNINESSKAIPIHALKQNAQYRLDLADNSLNVTFLGTNMSDNTKGSFMFKHNNETLYFYGEDIQGKIYATKFANESEDTTTGYKISFLNEAIDEVLQSTKAIPLSQINPVVAKKAVETGLQDGQIKDDQVTYKKATIPVNKLKGAQTEIIPEKAVQMALGMMLSQPLKIGGDLGSMISGDNYIMDGHHRWAATYLCDPKASVSGTQISLKGNLLVTALNVVTKGHFNRSGNPGKGDIKDFTSKVIKPILENYAENGIPGQYPMQATEVQTRLGRVPGANGDYLKGIDIMSKNADALPKDIMPGAPARVDMPVINPEEVHKVADDIAKGKVDITSPYANEAVMHLKVFSNWVAFKNYADRQKVYDNNKYIDKKYFDMYANNVIVTYCEDATYDIINTAKKLGITVVQANANHKVVFLNESTKTIKIGQKFNADGLTWEVVTPGDTESAVRCVTKSNKNQAKVYDNKIILKFLNESTDYQNYALALIDIANQFAEIPEQYANQLYSSKKDIDNLLKSLLDEIPRKHHDAFDKYASTANAKYLNESELQYAIKLVGGSIGENRPKTAKDYAGQNASEERLYSNKDEAVKEAKAKTKRHLSDGERKYYKLKYVAVPVKDGKFVNESTKWTEKWTLKNGKELTNEQYNLKIAELLDADVNVKNWEADINAIYVNGTAKDTLSKDFNLTMLNESSDEVYTLTPTSSSKDINAAYDFIIANNEDFKRSKSLAKLLSSLFAALQTQKSVNSIVVLADGYFYYTTYDGGLFKAANMETHPDSFLLSRTAKGLAEDVLKKWTIDLWWPENATLLWISKTNAKVLNDTFGNLYLVFGQSTTNRTLLGNGTNVNELAKIIKDSKELSMINESGKYLNESIESDSIINDLQKLDAKLELYHHNTKAFSQHKAYDEIYAAFDFYKDDLIEKIIGYTGDRYKSVSVQVEYTDTTGIELVSDLANLSLNLASFAEANGYSDLKNISDSLSGLSAKLNYLLTLNEAASSYYVTCIDGSDMFWNSKVDEKLMFDRLEDAHTYGKSKRHGNEYWYCVYNANTNSELLQERTKFVNGKFVTNYLK